MPPARLLNSHAVVSRHLEKSLENGNANSHVVGSREPLDSPDGLEVISVYVCKYLSGGSEVFDALHRTSVHNPSPAAEVVLDLVRKVLQKRASSLQSAGSAWLISEAHHGMMSK